MPISLFERGRIGRIRQINGEENTRKHLREIGFVEGETIKVISKLFGSVIVDVKGSRIALDESMAKRIIVS